MKLSDLRPAPGAVKARKRVGRGPGSGHGKTSTKGNKGHNARSGGGKAGGFEGGQMALYRRPRNSGFRPPGGQTGVAVVNFQALGLVTPNDVLHTGEVGRDGVSRESGG